MSGQSCDKYIRARSVDNLGNTEGTSDRRVKVDKKNPTISSVSLNDNTVQSSHTIDITSDGSDADSGIDTCYGYRSDDQTFGDADDVQLSDLGGDCNGTNVGLSSPSEGTYYIYVEPIDVGGNSNNARSSALTVDDTDPTIGIDYPASAANISSSTVNITGTASDMNQDTVVINDSIFGSNQGSYGSWNFTNRSLVDGTYVLNITANDTAGNTNSSTLTVTIDTQPPAVTELHVNDSNTIVTSDQPIRINASVTDTTTRVESGVAGNSTNVSLAQVSGNAYAVNTTADNVGCIEGNCTVTVYANDSAGNLNASESITLTIDDTAPVVSNSHVNDSIVQSSQTVQLNVTVNDTDGAGVSNVLVGNDTNITMNEVKEHVYQTNTTPNTLGCSGEGNCQLRFWANDSAGNWNGSETQAITIDDTVPAVSQLQTNDSVLRTDASLHINVTVTDANRNDSDVFVGDSSDVQMSHIGSDVFAVNTTPESMGCAADSDCELTVTATDTADNVNNTIDVDIITDNTNPAVTELMVNDSVVNATVGIRINVSVTDTNSIVSVNASNSSSVSMSNVGGSKYAVNTTAGSLGCSSDGSCAITIAAEDGAGNVNATITTAFTVDNTASAVTNIVVNNSVMQSDAKIQVNATVTDNNSIVSVNVSNGTPVSMANVQGDVYQTETTPQSVGCGSDSNCTLQIVAEDEAANVNNTEGTEIAVDDTHPNILIDYPINEANISSSVLNITGTASDKHAETIFINNSHFQPNEGTFSAWNFTNSSLVDGSYSVNVTANDTAGNTNSSVVSFTVDTQPPDLSYTEETAKNDSFISHEWLFTEVEIAEKHFKNATFRLYNASSRINKTANRSRSGTNTTRLNWTELADGNYTVNVTAFDWARNRNTTASRTVTVDTLSPAIAYRESDTPADGTTVNQTWFTINVSVTEPHFANLTYQVTRPAGTANITTVTDLNNSNTHALNFTNLSDATYSFNVTAKDRAGNLNVTTNRSVTIDTERPSIRLTENTTNDSLVTNKTWITAEIAVTDDNFKNATAFLYNTADLVNSTTITTLDADNTSTINWTDLSDGQYQLNATAIDQSGLRGKTVTRTVTIDTTAPQVIAIHDNASVPNPTQTVLHSVKWDDLHRNSFTFGWNATGSKCESGFQNISTQQFSSEWANVSQQIPSSCRGKLIGWRIYANDTLGHSAISATQTYQIANLTIAASLSNKQPLSTEQLRVNATCTADNANPLTAYWRWYTNGSAINDTQSKSVENNTETALDIIEADSLSKGEHWTAQVWCGDTFQNTTHTNITAIVQNTPPQTPVLHAPSANATVAQGNVTFNYSATDADNDSLTYHFFLNGSLNRSGDANHTQHVPFGTYNWSVTASDGTNNTSSAKRRLQVQFFNVSLLTPNASVQLTEVEPNETIHVTARGFVNTEEQTTDIIWNVSINATACPVTNQSYANTSWRINCSAPVLDDGSTYDLAVSGNYTPLATQYTVQASQAIAYADTTPPEITPLSTARHVAPNTSVRIEANVTDNVNVSAVTATVDRPDTGTDNITLALNGSLPYTAHYTNITTRGDYNVTIQGNDTANLTTAKESFFGVFYNTTTTLIAQYPNSSAHPASFVFSRPTTGTHILSPETNATDGIVTRDIPNRTYQLDINSAVMPHNITLRTTQLRNTTNATVTLDSIDRTNVDIANAQEVSGLYGNISLVYNSAALTLSYNDTLVTDETQISLWRCADYQPLQNTCPSWQETTAAVNTTQNTVSANVTQFSAYMIAESEQTTGSGGGGDSSADGSSGGNGGGGGGISGGLGTAPEPQLDVRSVPVNILAKPGNTFTRQIKIENTGSAAANVTITQHNLPAFISTQEQLSITQDTIHLLTVQGRVPDDAQARNVTGTIELQYDDASEAIPITIRIVEARPLLDVRFSLMRVLANDSVRYGVELFNLGDRREVDVTIKSRIYDNSSVLQYQEKETLALATSTTVVRDLTFKSLKPGKYTLEVEAQYAGQTATTAQQFQIERSEEEPPEDTTDALPVTVYQHILPYWKHIALLLTAMILVLVVVEQRERVRTYGTMLWQRVQQMHTSTTSDSRTLYNVLQELESEGARVSDILYDVQQLRQYEKESSYAGQHFYTNLIDRKVHSRAATAQRQANDRERQLWEQAQEMVEQLKKEYSP